MYHGSAFARGISAATKLMLTVSSLAAQIVVEPAELEVARSHPAASEFVDTFAPGEEEGWGPCSACSSDELDKALRNLFTVNDSAAS